MRPSRFRQFFCLIFLLANTFISSTASADSNLIWNCSKQSLLSDSKMSLTAEMLSKKISSMVGKDVPVHLMRDVVDEVYPDLIRRYEPTFKQAYNSYFEQTMSSVQLAVRRFINEQKDCRFFSYIALGPSDFETWARANLKNIKSGIEGQRILAPKISFETGSSEREAMMFGEFYLQSFRPFNEYVRPVINQMSRDFQLALIDPKTYQSVATLGAVMDGKKQTKTISSTSTWKSVTGGKTYECSEVNGKIQSCEEK